MTCGASLFIPPSQPATNDLRNGGVPLFRDQLYLSFTRRPYAGAMIMKIGQFLRATAIEYGLIAAGISVVIIAAVNGTGTPSST
jgi:Flp/Fap pilin component